MPSFRHFLGVQEILQSLCQQLVVKLDLRSMLLTLISPLYQVECRAQIDTLFQGSRLKKYNKMQQYADIYLLLNYSTCFGRPSRPSSGVHKTVVAASGTVHTIWGTSFFKRDQIRKFEEDGSPDSMNCTRGYNYIFM